MGKGNPNPENQWEKGQSGNPGGAPKKENSITNMLRNMPDKDKQEIKDKIIELAKSGDFRFAQLALERMDGKVKDEVSIEGVKLIFENKTEDE